MQKREIISNLKEIDETIAIVGNEVNDTLASATAYIRIAVVSATDVSIRVPNIVLTNQEMWLFLQKLAFKGERLLSKTSFRHFSII